MNKEKPVQLAHIDDVVRDEDVVEEVTPSLIESFVNVLKARVIEKEYIEHLLADINVSDSMRLTSTHQLHAITFYYLRYMLASREVTPMEIRYAMLHKASPSGWLAAMGYTVVPYFYDNIQRFIKLNQDKE